jgi:aminopeptidase-like protein
VCIDSTLADGVLNYAELVLKGDSDREVLISTYVCHPSLANNELSGPVVAIFLAKWIAGLKNRHFTYRFVFAPETIGAIAYSCLNEDALRERVYAGFNLTCIGDERGWSCIATPKGNALADEVACLALMHRSPDFKRHSYLGRGSDERQYASPNMGLPMVSVMRTRFADYPEYHSSLDNLEVVTEKGLHDSLGCMQSIVRGLENNVTPLAANACEPQLGKRGLYISQAPRDISQNLFYAIWDVLAFSDGATDFLEICCRTGLSIEDALEALELLRGEGLVSVERHYRVEAGKLPPVRNDTAKNRPDRLFFIE